MTDSDERERLLKSLRVVFPKLSEEERVDLVETVMRSPKVPPPSAEDLKKQSEYLAEFAKQQQARNPPWPDAANDISEPDKTLLRKTLERLRRGSVGGDKLP